MPLPLWLRSFAKQLDNPKRQKVGSHRPRHSLRLELMEERLAPTITPAPNFAGNAVVFNGAPTDTLHLEVVGGLLKWSSDGVNFNSDLDPGTPGVQAFTVNSASQITSNLFGTLFIQGMTGGAGTYTASSSNIEIDNSIFAEGSNLAFVASGTGENIVVAPASTPVVISTRDIAIGGNPATAPSIGNSGDLLMTATNITLGTATNSAALYSQATNPFTPGSITLAVLQDGGIGTGQGFSFPLLPHVLTSTATITLNNATVVGGAVTFTSETTNLQVLTAAPTSNVPTSVQTAIIGLENLTLIAGVTVSTSTSTITLGAASSIKASSFTATTSATADAEIAPIAIKLGVAVGVDNTTSTINVAGKIDTTGDTFLQSNAVNTLSLFVNAGGNIKGAGAAVAVGVINSTSTATVAPTAILHVGGDLTDQATTLNQKGVTAISTTQDDGKVGVAAAIAYTDDTTSATLGGTATVGGDVLVQSSEVKTSVAGSKAVIIPTIFSGVTATAGVGTDDTGDLILNLQGALTTTVLGKLGAFVTSKSTFIASLAKKLESEPGGTPSFQAAAAVAVDMEDNSSTATISPHAVVRATGNIAVDGNINDRPGVSASSTVAQPTNPNNTGTGTTAFDGSVAVAVGLYTNTAKSYIDTGAAVDAGANLSVTSEALNDFQLAFGLNIYQAGTQTPTHTTSEPGADSVTINPGDIVQVDNGHTAGGTVGDWYKLAGGASIPNLNLTTTDFSDIGVWTDLGPGWQFKSKSVVQNFTTYLDNSFGLDKNLADTWSQATSTNGTAKVAVAGSLTLLNLGQTSNAYIGQGAQVNQNASPTYRTGAQDVFVLATGTNSSVNLGGSVQTPGLAGSNQELQISVAKPGAGVSAAQASVGAAVVVIQYTDDDEATINSGVHLYADSLDVDAETAVSNIGALISGGSSDNFGFIGVFSWVTVDDTTIAQIANAATITIGNADVVQTFPKSTGLVPALTTVAIQSNALPGTPGTDADGNTTNTINASLVVQAHNATDVFALSGGIMAAQNAGVGAAANVSLITRDTEAFIGDPDGTNAAQDSDTVTSGGNVIVDAKNTGTVGTLSLAAAKVADSAPQPNASGLQNAPSAQGQSGGSYGIGISGDASFNQINDTTLAYIHNVAVSAPALSVNSTNNTFLLSIAGSVALVLKANGTSVGLAGSYTQNNIGGTTEAFIDNSTVTLTGDLTVDAITTGQDYSIAASGSLATNENGIAVAGQVSVNQVSATTEADIVDGSSITANDVTLTGTDSDSIFAISGALAYGGKAGIGAAVSLNFIPSLGGAETTDSFIQNSDVAAGGAVQATATGTESIFAITAAVGASKSGMAGALAVSINTISPTNEAYISGKGTTGVKAVGDVTLSASDDSTIQAIAGGVGVTGGVAGFGLAFADNVIAGTTETGILNSATVVSLRTVEEKTVSTPTIQIIAVAGGAAVPGGGGGPAVGAGAAIALNSVTSGVLALIDPTSIVQAASVTLEDISTALIQILAIGAGGALSNGDGVAVTGAGSGASNTIADTVQAEIKTGSLVTASTGAVTLTATDTSTIQALAGALAVSFAAGDGGVASLSVGASVAVNDIDNTVQTLITDATVSGAGGVVMNATEGAQIEALTVAGTFSVATGSSGAVGFGGAGAGSGNTIDNTVSSTIVGGSMVSTGMAGAVQVTASDTAGITANAGSFAGSVALSEGALGGAVGAAAAVNTIGDTVEAYVDHSNVTSGGAVKIDASADDSIFTIAVGVALAVSGGEGGGLGFAGAGSGSGNTIVNTVEASIKDGSTVTSADLGAVNVTATDQSTITAAAGSVALGLAGGQGGGIGLAVGLSVASNQLGTSGTPDIVQAFIDNSNVTGAGGVNLTATSTPKIWVLTIAGSFTGSGGEAGGVAFAGAGAGSGNSIQESVGAIISGGSLVKTTSGAVSLSANDDPTIIADAGGISLAGAFGQGGGAGVTVGAAVAINTISNTVTASIEDATVNSAGGVNVTATSGASILAVAVGVAGSLAGGEGGGIALAGAGSGSGNTIDNTIEASIKEASQVTSTGPVTLTATDGSTITAGSGTLTFSVAGGMGGGFAGSVGVAASSNEIGNTVTAAVEDSVVHASGAVGINANNSSTILAVTVAGGAAVGGGEGGGVAFALAGAGSGNTIANTTLAFINQGSTVTTTRGQNIQVTATDSSSITADGGGGTLAGSGGAGGGISAAIGAGVAVNTITNDTEAYIDGSTVTSAGKLTLSATSTTSHIDVVSVGVAIAASGGAVAAVAAAGSGASATNTIANKIKTFVVDSSTVSAAAASADAVNMTATDNSDIHSRAYAVSAAVGIAPGSVALAVGVVLAENNIDNTVESFVGSATGPADGTKVTSSGGVEANANSTSTIDSEGVAVGASVSLVGLAGSGASALNNTDSTIAAFVQNSATVTAAAAVQIGASDGAVINSTVGTGAFSVGLVAVSIGVSLNNSTIADTVSAYIGQAKVTTTGGNVTVSATSTATIGGEAVATSVAAGIGASGAGGESTSTDNVVTQAYLAAGANVATHGGLLSIASTASLQIGAEADGGSLGLVSIGVMKSTATLNGATRAYIGEGVKVNAGGVTVKALSQNGGGDAVTATTSLVNIGGVAIGVTTATANIEDTTEAFVGPEAGSTPTNSLTTITVTNNGTLLVDANSTTTAKVNAPGGSDGSITVSSTAMNANVDGATNAYLGGQLTLAVPTATVKAESTNSGTTSATMVGVAIAALNVAQVEAENSRGVSAYIANGANLQAPSTNLTLQSNSTENATANLNGGNGGVINVAVLIDSATVSGTTQAYVPAGAMLNVGALSVNADVLGANANNDSTLVAIGLASGAGTQSNATVSGSSIAYVNGIGSTLKIGGPLSISAKATSGTVDQATVGAGGVLSAAGASATANDSETTKAYLAAGAALIGSGPVTITADGTATPSINLTVGSGGVISGGGATATVNDTTSTQAYIDTGSTIGTAANPGGSVTIAATGIDEGNNSISIGSGGVLTGNGTTVTTNVDPNISAYLANNAKIYSSGSVNVTATSTRAEGHSTAKSISIGGVAVGDPIANATTAPVVQSYLSHGTSISATGNVNVSANADDTPSQTLNDQIQGVDPNTSTITFPQSGLSNGDLVQYNPNGDATPIQTPNGTLDSTRTYQVVVTGPDTVKLGSSFPAVPVNPGSVTPPAGVFAAGNTIVFGGPDQFVTGDAVSYDTNGGGSISNELNTTGTYYVRTVGPNSIKLYATKAEATAAFDTFNASTGVSGNTFKTSSFTTNPQSFSNGDLVSYQASAPFTFSSANVVNGDQIKLPSTSGLHSGDQVSYQTTAPAGTNPISPLSSGVPYFVIVVNSTTIELDLSKADAQSPLPLNPIALTPAANSGQYIEQIQQQAIGGLVSGQTYQVINVNVGTNSFQLANPGSNTPITLSVGAASGTQQLGLDGIQLDNLAHAGGLQDFYLAITGPATTGPTGGELLAPGGASLRSVNVPPGSGITSAYASGGTGGVGAFSFPSSSANLNPSVQSWVDADSVTAGGDVSILANTVSSVTATANNGSGGAITVGTAKATASYNGNAQAFVGVISGPTIDATGVKIVAAGNVRIASGETVTTNVNTSSTSGGFIAGSDSESTSNATTNTVAAIGANAVVVGKTVAVDAINPSLSETTNATADAFGAGASATANTTNNATGNAVAHIYQNALVTGAMGVDVIANNNNFTDNQDPSATNISLTPFLVSEGQTTNAAFNTNVIADPGATVTAGQRGASTPLQNAGAVIALYVDADDTGVTATESRTVVWNANVNLTNAVAAPVLIIGPNGAITQATGLSASIVGNTVVVSNLVGANAGEALFIGTDSVTNTANNPYPVFNIHNTYQTVTIINQSSLNLELQNIGTASTTAPAYPQVQIEAKGATRTNIPFFFSIANNGPSVLDIENQNPGQTPSNIIIAGLLNNPTGHTIITNVRGDILSTGPAGIIRANQLDLTASGNIGTSINRINADLVEFTNPATSVLMVPTLTATAATGNVYLALTPRQADTSAGPASVLVNSLTAGQQVDVTMQQAQTIQEPSSFFAGALVAVENLPGGTFTQGNYYTFFHPDTVSVPTAPGNPPLKSVVGNYTINAITAVGNVTLNVVQASDTATMPGVIKSTTGGLTKNGAGLLVLSGSSPNLYSGVTTVNGGTLNLSKTTGPAVPGDLVANTGTIVNLQANNQTAPTTNVTLNGATFNVGFIPSPGVIDSIASLVLNTGTVQIGKSGDLKLNGNVSAGGTGNSVIQGSGSLDLNGMTRIFTVSTGLQLTISAPIVGGAGSGLTFTGGTLLFNSAANTYQGTTTVLNGNLNLNSTAVAIPGNLIIGDGVGGANTAVVNAKNPMSSPIPPW